MQRLVHVLGRAIETRENPAIFESPDIEAAMPADCADESPTPTLAGRSPGSIRSTFMNMKRAAFHILLAKFRYPAVRLSLNAISFRRRHRRQGEARRVRPVLSDHLNRVKHVPFVFDIFCRSASRTKAWMYTRERNARAQHVVL